MTYPTVLFRPSKWKLKEDSLMRHLTGIFIMSILTLNVPASALAKGKTVTITAPSNNSDVEENAQAKGKCSPPVAGDIWVFVWPEGSPGLGYPQSPNNSPTSCNKEKEEWSTSIFFRGEPQRYEVAVYLATAAASKEISKFLVEGAKHNHYPGMRLDSLPRGLIKQQRVMVIKRL
jgi:hypothetical protein